MGFGNPQVPWIELEHQLSDRGSDGRPPGSPPWTNAGGDSPAWSRRRQPYKPPPALERRADAVPYAELHCHSNFSFLDGASHPEELAEEAARLGLEALALTDHDGFYGVVRFAEAAARSACPPCSAPSSRSVRPHAAERRRRPAGSHMIVLAAGPDGYARLGRAISHAQMAGEKGAPRHFARRARRREPHERRPPLGDWWVLTGCRKGAVCAALVERGPAAAERELQRLVDAFGRDRVAVELWDHGDPLDSVRNDALAEIAIRAGVDLRRHEQRALRHTRSAPARDCARRGASPKVARRDRPWLPAGAGAHLRSGAEQARRFARYPGVVEAAAELGRACAFDLALVAPDLPPFPCPPRHDEMSWLRALTWRGAERRYGTRAASSVCPVPTPSSSTSSK